MSASEKIIILNHVTKRYGNKKVLNDVSVAFEKGQIHGIIGRNGSGKTLMFKSICGLLRVDEGTVNVMGRYIGKDVDIPDDVGIIIEQPGFLPHYSGLKNLRLLALLKNTIPLSKVKETIKIVGLDPESKLSVGKYSQGMKQRLGIAQAIMENQQILVLDEPMNGLDKQGLADMRELFLTLKREGRTILLASHNVEDIDLLCDTVHEMDQGQLTPIES